MNEDTKQIRDGEQIDEQSLRSFLRENVLARNDEIEIAQFSAGSSNLTYLVKFSGEEYGLRRPPFGNQIKSAHDMSREYSVLEKLSKVYRLAPKPVIYCADANVIGAEFYLMERRRGLIIRGAAPAILENSSDLQRAVCKSFIGNLANLHRLDYEKIGLSDLGKPRGYAKRQVEGWTKRYSDARTDEHVELEKSVEWLNENIPATGNAALLHNDYKFDNVMLDPENPAEIVAVLDWEMATVGDPLMDLGTTLGYWMSQKAGAEMLSLPFNPRVLMESVSRRELVEMYAEKSGRDVSDILFYYVFGTFKIAVIAQQIYYRYVQNLTRDARFARFNFFVGALGKIALSAIENENI